LAAKILDGKRVSAHVKSEVREKINHLKQTGVQPCLATVLVGDDPASDTYITNKQRDAKEVGIITKDHRLRSTLKENELIELIQTLNEDPIVHGILVQLPLPTHITEFTIVNKICPAKDVDGLTPFNAGMLQNRMAILKPCTPAGVIEMLDYYGINIRGMDVVIVNRSNLVGIPLSLMLLQRDATVMICHSMTKDLNNKLRTADLVITAVGNRSRFSLTADMIKEDAIVIDIGIARLGSKLVGDADFDSVKQKASWITPVPGGVGLMTRAMLLKNTISAAASIT
jgi:methylenetetrahydrofolate dehydrogenase (NADP+)/methenyltetrahydrofolate cyclohydrolase